MFGGLNVSFAQISFDILKTYLFMLVTLLIAPAVEYYI